jgi:NAD(P)H-hydrate epimerase
VKSDVCVSFGGMKAVNVFSPARDLCGQVICRDIGFGSNALQEAKNEIPSKAVYICEFDFRDDPWEEKLSPSAHKFDRGHVLVIGGSEGKTGAPILSGLAALRAGAGWASVAIPPTLLRREKDIPLELTFEDFFDGKHIDAECLSVFLKDRNVRSVVIGPGTMDSCLDTESFEVLTAFAAQGHFVIVDAGATRGFLDFLEDKDPLAASRFILTPHPGEWRQLGGDLLQDFFSLGDLESCAQKIRKIGVNLCYKGATPIIFSSDVPAVFTGNDNSLAKAGTGDIVSGLSGACSLISDSPVDILGRAFSLMQRSVERLIKERNRHSLLPSDLLPEINKN